WPYVLVQAEGGIRGFHVTGVQTCALPIFHPAALAGGPLLTGERGWVEWTVEVPEAGWYSIEIDYYPAPGRGTSIEREIQINGEVLFSGAELLVFHRIFGDEGPFLKDIGGNEIRPRQVEKPMWRTVFLSDSLGYVRGPYQFYLREGENTIRLI